MKAYLYSIRPVEFSPDQGSGMISGSYLGLLTPTSRPGESGYEAFNLFVSSGVASPSDFCIGSLYEFDLIPRMKGGKPSLKCVGVLEICS